MAETQSTTTTTTTATAPTGDIKVFIDAFNKDFDLKLKSLLDAQQNYKNAYADAIKITTPKEGPWPNDPKVVTIGDLFKYTFPDIESDKIVTPPRPTPTNYEDYVGWSKDLKDSKDEKISNMFSTISDGIKSNSQIKDYQALQKPGVTNPNLWSPGQYYFDVFMKLMLSPDGPLKNPTDSNGGYKAFGGDIISGGGLLQDWLKNHGGSASVSSFDPADNFTEQSTLFGYSVFYEILDGGYSGTGIKYRMSDITGISAGLGDQSPIPPKSYVNIKTQYKSGLLSEFISIENGKIVKKDPSFEFRGEVRDPSDKYVSDEKLSSLNDITGYKFVGNYEQMFLYKAFIQAGDNYKPVVLPLRNPEPPVTPDTPPVIQKLQTPQEVGYTFNVEKKDTFTIVGGSMSGMEFTIVPNDGTTYIVNEAPINKTDDEDMLSEEYGETGFAGEEELAVQFMQNQALQGDLPPDITPSNVNITNDANINYNDPAFVGPNWKSFNIDSFVTAINKTPHKPNSKFVDSLKKVLYFIKQDADIKDAREAAYILATAFAESGYSLQRWEADYACSGAGIPYGSSGPCSSATSYYRSTKGGKSNYYTLGTDKNGQCYFGRGLIQLTGKGNYEKYGKLIGADLANNGDLAMEPLNSYKVASVYMRGRTFKHVLKGDLTQARKSVNGGTKGINEVNGAYNSWITIFSQSSVA